MSEITVRKIDYPRELKKFIRFPFKVYKGKYPYWVPPLDYDQKNILMKEKNPFFQHAEMELFFAERDGEIVGRIAAIKNDLHNEVHNDKVGFFGFYEAFEEQEIADKLFDAAKEWLRSKGLNKMRGPASPSVNDVYGLLIEGFDDYPRLMMSYNPPYYIEQMENYGFYKAKDLYAYRIDRDKILKSEKITRVSQIAAKRAKVTVREVNLKDFHNELEKIKYVFNKAWEPNWGFVPFTDAEIEHAAKELKPLVVPEITIFAEVEGKTIGFALVMPDYNLIIKDLNGKLFPFGYRLFTQRKKLDWARILILGIIPEYQRRGIDAFMYYEITRRAATLGIDKGEASWILEDNVMMNRGAEAMNGTLYKKYRIYEIDV
jgi:GNAT superfamily N-acetyltransferase